jgi:chromosome segregation ATPase
LALVLTALVAGGPFGARAVDLQLFTDPDKACAYIATAQAEDVAMMEIWLTILQRDAANSWAVVRSDLQRLDGEARTIEKAIVAMDAQIAQGHATLRAARNRIRAIEAQPESATLHAERDALEAEMRATSEELIERSFDLRDAKARLATMQAAIAGHRDIAAVIDAAQATVREFGDVIHDCARLRRARLMAVAPDIGTQH